MTHLHQWVKHNSQNSGSIIANNCYCRKQIIDCFSAFDVVNILTNTTWEQFLWIIWHSPRLSTSWIMTPPMWVSPRTLSDLSTCRSVTKMLSCHDPSPYTVLLPDPTLWAMGGGLGRWRPAPWSWGCLMVLCMVSTGSQLSDEAGHHYHVRPHSCLSWSPSVFTVICVTTPPVTDNNSNRAGVRTGYICPPGHQVDWAGLGWLLITGHRSPASCVCLWPPSLLSGPCLHRDAGVTAHCSPLSPHSGPGSPLTDSRTQARGSARPPLRQARPAPGSGCCCPKCESGRVTVCPVCLPSITAHRWSSNVRHTGNGSCW